MIVYIITMTTGEVEIYDKDFWVITVLIKDEVVHLKRTRGEYLEITIPFREVLSVKTGMVTFLYDWRKKENE